MAARARRRRSTGESGSCSSGFRGAFPPRLSSRHALEALDPGDQYASSAPGGVSIWLHDRRARELVLAASSDPRQAPPGRACPTESDTMPATRPAARRPAVRTRSCRPYRTLVAPLRGWRRALGTLVIDGASRASSTSSEFVDFAAISRGQLSVALENVQLLEDVLRQRRLLEDTFNSLVDLVVVTDSDAARRPDERRVRARVGRDAHDIIGGRSPSSSAPRSRVGRRTAVAERRDIGRRRAQPAVRPTIALGGISPRR